MCGRKILGDSSWAAYHEALSIIKPRPAMVSYNIKPTNMHPIAYVGPDGLTDAMARWWFIPHWYKGDAKGWKATTFNARIETAREKPVFRSAWKTGRCVVPASGYYEWTGEKGVKQPWFITVETNAPVFFFAGLCSHLADGSHTYSILTRSAAREIRDIHDRMPVILTSDQIGRWLNHEDAQDRVVADYGLAWADRYLAHKVRPFGMHDDGPELIDEMEPHQ